MIFDRSNLHKTIGWHLVIYLHRSLEEFSSPYHIYVSRSYSKEKYMCPEEHMVTYNTERKMDRTRTTSLRIDKIYCSGYTVGYDAEWGMLQQAQP